MSRHGIESPRRGCCRSSTERSLGLRSIACFTSRDQESAQSTVLLTGTRLASTGRFLSRGPVMPKKTTSPKPPAGKAAKKDSSAAKAAARNTASGPSHPTPDVTGDRVAAQAAAAEELVSAMTHNEHKPGEFGVDNAL